MPEFRRRWTTCDQILGDPPRHHAPAITTAGGIVTALTKVLGSALMPPRSGATAPSADPQREAAPKQPIPQQTFSPSPRCLTKRPFGRKPYPPGRFRRPALHPPLSAHASQSAGSRQNRHRPAGPREATPRRQPPLLSSVKALDRLAPRACGAADRCRNHLRIILDRRLSGAAEPNASSDPSGTSESSPAQLKKLTIAQARILIRKARTKPRILTR